jgi:hypothetical protein
MISNIGWVNDAAFQIEDGWKRYFWYLFRYTVTGTVRR